MKKENKSRRPENTATTISLSRELMHKAKHRCLEDERTMSEYVRWLIQRDVQSVEMLRRKGA